LLRLLVSRQRSRVHYYHRRYRFMGHRCRGRAEAELVREPREYRWSSYPHWTSGGIELTRQALDEYAELTELESTQEQRREFRGFYLRLRRNADTLHKTVSSRAARDRSS
jgi:hypothetical protein